MLSDNQNNKLSALQLLLNAKFSNSADSVGSHRIVENERETIPTPKCQSSVLLMGKYLGDLAAALVAAAAVALLYGAL